MDTFGILSAVSMQGTGSDRERGDIPNTYDRARGKY